VFTGGRNFQGTLGGELAAHLGHIR